MIDLVYVKIELKAEFADLWELKCELKGRGGYYSEDFDLLGRAVGGLGINDSLLFGGKGNDFFDFSFGLFIFFLVLNLFRLRWGF